MSIDWSRPVRTKAGDAMRVICIDAPGEEPVVAINKAGSIHRYYIDGRYWGDSPSELDLENVPEERYVWVNVYKVGDDIDAAAYPFRREADRDTSSTIIARIKVKVEEGRFDE